MKITKVLLFLLFLAFSGIPAFAQTGRPAPKGQAAPKAEKVELLRADALEVVCDGAADFAPHPSDSPPRRPGVEAHRNGRGCVRIAP